MFYISFKIQGKPESLVEINQSLQGIADKVKKIEGCAGAWVYKDINDDSVFFLLEKWQKQRDLDDHIKSSLFAALLGIEVLLVGKPEITFMTEH